MAAVAAVGVARRRRLSPVLPLTYLVSIVLVGLSVVPILLIIVNGFRSNAQINNSPAGVPSPWVWSNYSSVLTSSAFWEFLGNSALVAVIATGLTVVLGSMAGFALSRYSFRGREVFYTIFVAGLLLPIQVGSLPLYLLLDRLQMLNSEVWVGVAEAAYTLPITIVILRPFMRAIPGDLEDAAVVDGASRLRFFVRILLPLSRPALITVALLAFVTSWNQYLLPLLAFNVTSKYTLPLGDATFQTEYSQNTAGIMAFTALSILPALAFFLIAQRQLVAGAAGAVKG
ncbi:MAG: carbohydrate ABC transporter permease [Streptosporangiaceae bacterium]|jgi:raffinose/stachyose/melibiose transport system permease protein